MIIYLGGSMDPGVAYLLIRGIKTLGVRVARQCENAIAVAKYLERHSKVARVHYPGLPSHPDHKIAKKQMRGFGGMLAFDLKGGLPAARTFREACEVPRQNLESRVRDRWTASIRSRVPGRRQYLLRWS